MTMRTYTHLECQCGYRMTIKLSENDQPYSTPWEQETDMPGDHRVTYPGPQTTFAKYGRKCPQCGS